MWPFGVQTGEQVSKLHRIVRNALGVERNRPARIGQDREEGLPFGALTRAGIAMQARFDPLVAQGNFARDALSVVRAEVFPCLALVAPCPNNEEFSTHGFAAGLDLG